MTSPKSLTRTIALLGAITFAPMGAFANANNAADIPEATSTASFAQMSQDDGASARVDQAGKLRMLSQRVVAVACYVRAGVAPSQTLPALMNARSEFDAILAALEVGDPDRGIIGAEERRRTLVGLGKLRDEFWAPVSENAGLVASGAGDATHVAQLAADSAPLLDFAKRMVSEISAQYSDPTVLLQSDAMLIDVAGRQRMLSQRISKNACLLGTGLGSEAISAELTATMSVFDTSLYALFHGMPETGIKAPPTDEIGAALSAVVDRWTAIQPLLTEIAAGQSTDSDTLAMIFTETSALTAEMNSIVGMYGEASKLGL